MAVNHKQVYMDAFGHKLGAWVACECCEGTAHEIHHIWRRGMGGSKAWDFIENLMALCVDCHREYGDITELRPELVRIHELRRRAAGLVPDQQKLEWVRNGRCYEQ